MKKNFNKCRSIYSSLIYIFVLLIGAVYLSFAQSSLIEVSAAVDQSVITIGDRITYTLIIKHDKNLKIEQPGPAANLGMFEIKDYEFHEPTEQEGIIVEQYDYTISVYDTGKFVIPPFPVAFFASDTSHDYQIIKSEPIDITVKSLLQAEDTDIKDIKPPLLIPANYLRLILVGGGILLLIAIVIFAIYYYRKRKKGEPLFRKEVIRPAHEIAFEELELLLRKSYINDGKFKQFFIELSDILRHYLENRFYITAMEETTTEVLESIKEIELPDDSFEKAKEVLDLSDLVKFAKYEPQQQEIDRAVELSREFISLTRLEFEPVETIKEVEENALSPDGKPDV